MTNQTQTFSEFVKEHYGGELYPGEHEFGEDACALEAYSRYIGTWWTSEPEELGIWDMRDINDASWSSPGLRAEHMVALIEALADCRRWAAPRQRRWTERVAIRTVSEVLPAVLRAIKLVAEADRCAAVTTIDEAEEAALAARRAAESVGSDAGAGAAEAARAAADAADAARDAKAGLAKEAFEETAEAASTATGWTARAAITAEGQQKADEVLILASRIWREEANLDATTA